MCCSGDEVGSSLPAPAPRSAGSKRPLTLAEYDPAPAERRAKRTAAASSSVSAVPFDVEPISAVPLAAVAPGGRTAEPAWIRRQLLPRLGLRADLLVHFVDSKAVTQTDVDPHQSRFRLPSDGVQRRLRPILSPEDLAVANLLTGEGTPRPRPPKQLPVVVEGEQQGTTTKTNAKKKRTGKKHGGLRVRVVDVVAGVKELQLSRWDSSRGTVVKGEGYLDFVSRCSFKEGDSVGVWAFKQRAFHHFGVTMCAESPLYLVVAKTDASAAAAIPQWLSLSLVSLKRVVPACSGNIAASRLQAVMLLDLAAGH